MRAIWNGNISFGLLQVPVQLYSATRDLDLHFRLLDGRDQRPIRYERVNTVTGREVPWGEVVKAYKARRGGYLVVDDQEIKSAAPEQNEAIELEAFVERIAVDPIYFERPYYVAPAKRATRSYVLLREALAASGRVGIARVVLRTRQYLSALHGEGPALMLTLMRFHEELLTPADVGLTTTALGEPKLKPAELEMAQRLLESMSVPWRPADYRDEFRNKLRQHLEARAAHHKLVTEPARTKATGAPASNVVDLVALLRRSLEEKAPHPRSRAR